MRFRNSQNGSIRAAVKRFKAQRHAREWLLLFFWLYLVECEMLVRQATAHSFLSMGLVLSPLFSIVAALLIYTLCSAFSHRVNRVMAQICVYTLFIFYASQLVYHHIFHFFYYSVSVGNGGQAAEFWLVALKAIWAEGWEIVLMLLPAVFLSIFGCIFDTPTLCRLPFLPKRVQKIGAKLLFLPVGLALHFLLVFSLPLFGTSAVTPYDLYHKTNDLALGAEQLGLLPAFRLDLHRMIFGFESRTLVEPIEPTETEPPAEPTEPTQEPTEPPTEPPAEPPTEAPDLNILDIDFDALMEGETDETILQLHKYFSEQEATAKNDKTGIFEGCNLIFITAESLSYLAIDPELTPTLYMLQTQGFHFTNYYTPYWGVSTSDGEYTLLTGTIPKSGTWSFLDSADNAMPLTLAQQLKKQGYSAYAYHNHDYTYYNREQSHPNLGYIFKGVGNGLELTEQMPESDIELIDQTTAEFLGQEPFHVYYLTMSGHLPHSFDSNPIAQKNRDLVEHLPYSDNVKAYLAGQIELDRALALLLERLDEAGVAENTVIALAPDHYPYGLTTEEYNELAGEEIDARFELYRNAFLLYKKGMKPETVDKLCSSLDVLPTLSNLFGLEFDSRLYMGKDSFSDAKPLMMLANRSWMTEKASYYTLLEEATSLTDEPISAEKIEYYNSIVANKFLVSEWVLDTDYWRLLFGDNLPPDLPPDEPLIPPTEILPPDKGNQNQVQ